MTVPRPQKKEDTLPRRRGARLYSYFLFLSLSCEAEKEAAAAARRAELDAMEPEEREAALAAEVM